MAFAMLNIFIIKHLSDYVYNICIDLYLYYNSIYSFVGCSEAINLMALIKE